MEVLESAADPIGPIIQLCKSNVSGDAISILAFFSTQQSPLLSPNAYIIIYQYMYAYGLLQLCTIVGSHEMMGKGYVNAENTQMASIGIIFCSTYHTKQLNPWPNSSASRVVNYNQLSAHPGRWSHLKTT